MSMYDFISSDSRSIGRHQIPFNRQRPTYEAIDSLVSGPDTLQSGDKREKLIYQFSQLIQRLSPVTETPRKDIHDEKQVSDANKQGQVTQ